MAYGAVQDGISFNNQYQISRQTGNYGNTYKEGARIFPSLVPTTLEDQAHHDNTTAWEVLRKFERPFLCAFGDSDPVTKGGDANFIRSVPGAAGQPHTTVINGGHFIQEDKPNELANIINTFITTTRLP